MSIKQKQSEYTDQVQELARQWAEDVKDAGYVPGAIVQRYHDVHYKLTEVHCSVSSGWHSGASVWAEGHKQLKAGGWGKRTVRVPFVLSCDIVDEVPSCD